MTDQPTNTQERKPWPMSAVAASIAVFIVLYTVAMVFFRKPEPPHEPYAEALARQAEARETSMLEWTRFPVTFGLAGKPDGVPSVPNQALIEHQPTASRLDKALPVELVLVTPGRPYLHPGISGLEAPATIATGGSLVLFINPANNDSAFGEPWIYAKDHQLHVFLQSDEHVPANVTPVESSGKLRLALEPGALAPGEWNATAYTAKETFTWTFLVQ